MKSCVTALGNSWWKGSQKKGTEVVLGFMWVWTWKCWVYSQWNSHLIGIMISKTIGFRGLAYFQTHPCTCPMYTCILGWFYFSFSESNRNSIPHIHESLPDGIKRGNWKSTILMMFPTIHLFEKFSCQPPKILPEANLTENPININVKLKFKSLKLPLAFSVRLSSVQNPLLFNGLWLWSSLESSPFMCVA